MTATQSVASNDISNTRWQLWCQEYAGKLYSEEEGVSPPPLIGRKAGLEGNALFPPLMKQMNKSDVKHGGRCLQPLQCSDKTGAC